MQTIHTDKAPAAVGPYSQAILSGGLLFCSGQIALDPETGVLVGETTAEQARKALENVRALLDEAGVTFDDVVKTPAF